eukprot:6691037-Alexandrium_andersonii.AAC.1
MSSKGPLGTAVSPLAAAESATVAAGRPTARSAFLTAGHQTNRCSELNSPRPQSGQGSSSREMPV